MTTQTQTEGMKAILARVQRAPLPLVYGRNGWRAAVTLPKPATRADFDALLKSGAVRINAGNLTPASEAPQTSYPQRFITALTLLCDGEPPHDLCEQWLAGASEKLQEWVVSHVRADWATGIGAIEAAQHLADHPNEGEEHAGFAADYSKNAENTAGGAENWVVDGPDGKGFLLVNTFDDPDDQKAPCILVVGDIALAERVAAAMNAASI